MKFKITIIVLSLLFLIGVCTAETIFIDNTFTELETRLGSIEQNGEYDLEKIYETKEWWDKRFKVLEITVSVTLLNDLNYTYGELIGAVEAGDAMSASGYRQRLYAYCECLKKTYTVRWTNVF